MKKIFLILLGLLAVVALWYFFIKKFDYQVSYTVNAGVGETYALIQESNPWNDVESAKTIILEKIPFTRVSQKIEVADTTYFLRWNMEAINDSLTKISIDIKTEENTFSNRLDVLVNHSSFVETIVKRMTFQGKAMKDFFTKHKVEVEGRSEIPAQQYVSVSLQATRSKKARGMISANADLVPAIHNNDLKINGKPFVKINKWDQKTDSIKFEFGFSVRTVDATNLSKTSMHIKESLPQKALKARYYGNYADSDKAWYALIAYAKQNKIEVAKTPVEIFYNNPMDGGDDSKWRADVYLPIID